MMIPGLRDADKVSHVNLRTQLLLRRRVPLQPLIWHRGKVVCRERNHLVTKCRHYINQTSEAKALELITVRGILAAERRAETEIV